MSSRGIIAAEDPDTCELCGAFEETRPYGPNGERVCFACGMKDEATTRKRFAEVVLGENTAIN